MRILVLIPTITGREDVFRQAAHTQGHPFPVGGATVEVWSTLDQPDLGTAYEIGLEQMSADVTHVLFSGDDTTADPRWLQAAVAELEAGFLPGPFMCWSNGREVGDDGPPGHVHEGRRGPILLPVDVAQAIRPLPPMVQYIDLWMHAAIRQKSSWMHRQSGGFRFVNHGLQKPETVGRSEAMWWRLQAEGLWAFAAS